MTLIPLILHLGRRLRQVELSEMEANWGYRKIWFQSHHHHQKKKPQLKKKKKITAANGVIQNSPIMHLMPEMLAVCNKVQSSKPDKSLKIPIKPSGSFEPILPVLYICCIDQFLELLMQEKLSFLEKQLAFRANCQNNFLMFSCTHL